MLTKIALASILLAVASPAALAFCTAISSYRKRKRKDREALGDGPDFEQMDKQGIPVSVEAALPGEKPAADDVSSFICVIEECGCTATIKDDLSHM